MLHVCQCSIPVLEPGSLMLTVSDKCLHAVFCRHKLIMCNALSQRRTNVQATHFAESMHAPAQDLEAMAC